MNVTHLECALCGLRHEARTLQNLCRECGKPLLVRYDLESAAARIKASSYPQADMFAEKNVLEPPPEETIIEAYSKMELK